MFKPWMGACEGSHCRQLCPAGMPALPVLRGRNLACNWLHVPVGSVSLSPGSAEEEGDTPLHQARCCFQTAHQSYSAPGLQDERSRADTIATMQNPVPVPADSAGCSGGNSSVLPLSPGNVLLFWMQPRETNRD